MGQGAARVRGADAGSEVGEVAGGGGGQGLGIRGRVRSMQRASLGDTEEDGREAAVSRGLLKSVR